MIKAIKVINFNKKNKTSIISNTIQWNPQSKPTSWSKSVTIAKPINGALDTTNRHIKTYLSRYLKLSRIKYPTLTLQSTKFRVIRLALFKSFVMALKSSPKGLSATSHFLKQWHWGLLISWMASLTTESHLRLRGDLKLGNLTVP